MNLKFIQMHIYIQIIYTVNILNFVNPIDSTSSDTPSREAGRYLNDENG